MTKQGKKVLLIIGGLLLLFSMSSEFASMAKQLSFAEAILSFILITSIVLGTAYWIKRNKK